jgi:hypothetical protein
MLAPNDKNLSVFVVFALKISMVLGRFLAYIPGQALVTGSRIISVFFSAEKQVINLSFSPDPCDQIGRILAY